MTQDNLRNFAESLFVGAWSQNPESYYDKMELRKVAGTSQCGLDRKGQCCLRRGRPAGNEVRETRS